MTDMRKWIFTVRWESLNTGSLTGEKNLWKFIFLILEKMVLGIPIYKTVTAQNKDELQLVMFPNLKITFDELFDLGEY